MFAIGFYLSEKKAFNMFSKILVFVFAFLLLNVANPSFAQNDEKLVILHTQSGKIVIELFPEDALNHTENFIKLVDSGYYDRTVFHRVIKDFMIQGGDPKTKPGGYDSLVEWGTGGPGYTIDAEFNDIKHNRGIVSMARTNDPNGAGSQFFIVHKDSNFLDGQYTVFGRIATQESFETLDTIANLKTAPALPVPEDWGAGEILKAEVVNKADVTDLLDQGEPERTEVSIPTILSSEYSNEELGFSSTFPEGWTVQEPRKTNPTAPDVAAVGPKIGSLNPTISVSVTHLEGQSLDDRVNEIKENLQEAIDKGQLEILSEENLTIDGMNAYTITSKGIFIKPNGTVNIIFKETIIPSSDKFYAITYANGENNFDENLSKYEETLNSFTLLGEESLPPEGNDVDNGQENGGCLIATATFGSELAPQVQMLRELRDNTVLNTASGTSFMMGFNQFYYSFSPAIADWERENEIFKETIKLAITPLLSSLSLLNYVDIDSEEEMLGYGIGIILLNIGMYFVAPIGIGIILARKF
jgi:peptidyl-prolyl cis-trans isomerase B (cyclophilin B)